jgi:23S rRNA pseudouridine1911/1915/1917 synthase
VPRVTVTAEQAGLRVDHVVAAAIPGLAVSRARRLITAGAVRVDGRVAKKGEQVQAGQIVEIDDAPATGPVEAPVEPDPSVEVAWLHVDEALVAISKPAGVPSHPLKTGELGTAANAIVARFPECAAASPDAREGGLGHRLDNETSGVLLAARSRAAWDGLRAALSAPSCQKTYLAEVVGVPPEAGVETAPIGRAGRRGGRVRVGAGRQPLSARTEWEVVERRGATTLVRARLHAGRAHQVRAHLAAAGFPILGDPIYKRADEVGGGGGGRAGRAVPGGDGPAASAAPGLHLHAHTVALAHPTTGAPLLIEAPPPAWAILTA